LRTAILLTSCNLDDWSAKASAGPLPGGALPYGLQHLAANFRLTWSMAHQKGLCRTRLPRIAGGAIRRQAPGLQGSLVSCCSMSRLMAADVALSIFEDAGLGFGRWQALSPRSPNFRLPHVMIACWLAEDIQHMTPAKLISIRRSLRSISKVVVFSANQVPILAGFLGLPPERISVIPFGVDTRYYDPSAVDGQAGGAGVVAIGGDSRRDYATLISAAQIADVPLTLVCYPRNIAGLDLPPQVKLRSDIRHEEYRRLLLGADLVVTPTIAPAYPSGQSVVLEAMSLGRATLTTDSPAMRDYVTDGVDGALVPPRDPASLAELIGDLLADDDRRQSLGTTAAKTVRASFDLEHLWQNVATVLDDASEQRQRR
jgi:glycosyltransferase involved in cell wall biosynthesis